MYLPRKNHQKEAPWWNKEEQSRSLGFGETALPLTMAKTQNVLDVFIPEFPSVLQRIWIACINWDKSAQNTGEWLGYGTVTTICLGIFRWYQLRPTDPAEWSSSTRFSGIQACTPACSSLKRICDFYITFNSEIKSWSTADSVQQIAWCVRTVALTFNTYR